MKKIDVKPEILKSVGIIATIASAVSALTLVILHATGLTNLAEETFSQVFLGLACFIFVCGLSLFIVGKLVGANNAAQTEETPIEEVEEVASPETETPTEERPAPAPAPLEETLDKDLTLDIISDSLAAYAAENSLNLSAECAKNIIAAICSSRLIAVVGADAANTEKLAEVLNGYFGGSTAKILQEIMRFAYQNSNNITVADITPEAENIKSAFAARALSPDREIKVTLGSGYATLSYAIPPNIWAICALSALPAGALNGAAVIAFELGAHAPSGGRKTAGYLQLLKSAELCLDTHFPDEDKFWKKYDEIEKFIKKTSGYAADNKKKRAVEAFVCAYLACGGENAPDCTAAAHYAAPARISGISADDFVHIAESAFGEDSAAACKKIAEAVTGR